MRHFAGRVAVITGAAGGLGRALAREASALGMRLVLADIDADALERVTGELQAGGSEVLAMVCDVAEPSHVEELADAAMIRFHGVHLLFNNASAATGGLVWEHGDADWQRVLGANLWGAIHGVRVFVPLMLDSARRVPDYEGHIVNTATMAGLLNAPGTGAVNVSRHGVMALTETLYHDVRLAGAQLGVSVLCPGQEAAADVARCAFDGVKRGDFYLVPHPEGLAAVQERMEAIVQGGVPADPFLSMALLRDELLAGPDLDKRR
jgi:NAD(P)-dependent dehydrogenase (short-subunit alcohol dehydrogenase family)